MTTKNELVDVGSYKWKTEKLELEIEINQWKLNQWFSRSTDKDQIMKHESNLKKLGAMERREAEEWRKDFIEDEN